jgi:phosphoribosylglycinamide formyltransferase-1
MINLGVLVSGSGSNLQAIIDAIETGTLDARITCVISNVPGAAALQRAGRAGIPAFVVDHKDFPSRSAFEARLVEILRSRDVEWVVLAGFMRVVKDLLVAFPRRVINVHPSLLPAFHGLDAQGQALAYGVRFTGCTVHFVDEGMDTGPIIAQSVVPVLPDDDHDTLRDRILEKEHELLPQVLQWASEKRITLVDGPDGKRAIVTIRR